MASVADLARLWSALLISPLGRSCPRLVGATRAGRFASQHAGAGDCEPLPLFHEGVQALRRDRAASVRKEALQEWLQSEMAAAWRKVRAAILGSGEGPPILRGPDKADEEEGGTGGPAGVA